MRFFRRRARTAAAERSGSESARVSCLLRWRRCEQRTTRTWHAWLAAEPRQREALYRAFERALGEEERAAAELALVTAQSAGEDREGGLAHSAR